VCTSTLSDCVEIFRRRLHPAALATGLWTLLVITLAGPAVADTGCKIGQLAELPVTMSGTQPIVHALINGVDASFIADSGAFFNSMTPAAAAQYKLPLKMAPVGYYVSGVGGDSAPSLATVKEFTIFKVKFPNVLFVVVGNDFGSAAGLLGQNLFRIADTEYDLANGAIRIMRPGEGCKSVGLAYWATSTPSSQIDLARLSESQPHILGDVYLNGKKLRAMFDTGAGTSIVSLEGAKTAGITPTSEGVVEANAGYGIGQHFVRRWIAPFHSFKIGDEEIRDFKLRIGDIGNSYSGVEMLVGADFFMSHRIFVANDRAKLYFTYNGGPVFNLGVGSKVAQSQDESIAVASGGSVASAAQPTDAAAFSRRAMAASDRHDFASAVADLDRACELAPDDSDYRYQRGMAHWGNRQADLALADLDAAIKLKPDNAAALLARARLRAGSDVRAATSDLEAADRYLPKESVDHLEIGNLYEQTAQLPAALVQYSKWIDSHERTDVRMPSALNSRCWTRALMGQELEAALSDCNAALKLQPNTAAFLDSRGLVYLRLGNYDKSIADYDAALAKNAKIAFSHYGRGIARIRKGLTAEGQADIAEAVALSPKIAEDAGSHGIKP
jgi:tetratricopeptide (TPR) repeat protein/predicted aspartyl protease